MSKILLEQYAQAWNDHDIDVIMSFMTEDCVFETGGGKARYGIRYQGHDIVRERFIEVWTDIPDVRFENAIHFGDDKYGCSEWTFIGTTRDGKQLELDGCDPFTFRDRKISSKRSYLKAKK